ncbi:MAG: hypothetical protein A2275_06555 [Bacteroidetes bacterium RIFOXYA12_FULL_35_11]|nr:MAG: hypothetical protein A2X01_04095 [Bacteroidetes bacterium GWF2_35_48]OFY76735.1 MAG: hypothetical protein A2275_06555 [Bacteroidetes bacterium RIFOXYA12_FULL_35_11]OFY97806.1 MAG: hypothetical protein A2309_04660 [Bacteroidetes bacterium RIFOXYB2_FULL_35_7]OFZ06225.1 MAG: hypothetical protein A2491_13350 [Bacteroidetes bacterium RIFOXYC12_FULL_35_7]HBX52330.1 hypothetical protein [Bacteroidales bacterium]
MKKIFVILFLIPILISCTQQNGYEITGAFKNAEGRKIFLNKLLVDRLEKIDSAIINKEGNFIFDGKVDGPSFFMINLSDKEFVYLLIDSTDKILISADAKDIQKTVITEGSEGSLLLQKMHRHLLESLEQMDSLGLIYRAYYQTSQADSIMMVLNTASKKLMENEQKFLISFIQENKKSLVCYMALHQQITPREYILTPEQDFKVFQYVDSCMRLYHPKSQYTAALSSFMAQYISQKKEQDLREARIKTGEIAPEISLAGADGNVVTLSSYKGKFVLLDFWASWCAPCRKENPNLVKCYQKFKNKNFEIFQVSLDKSKDEWLSAIKKDQLTWKHASDLKYWDSPVVKLYAIQGIPANFLLDKNGKIIARNLRGDELEKVLGEVLR